MSDLPPHHHSSILAELLKLEAEALGGNFTDITDMSREERRRALWGEDHQ